MVEEVHPPLLLIILKPNCTLMALKCGEYGMNPQAMRIARKKAVLLQLIIDGMAKVVLA